MGLVDNRFEDNVLTTTVDSVINWARRSSIWPMQFGLACCAIEMMAVMDARFDLARIGAEVFRGTPRQSHLMIVAGAGLSEMVPLVESPCVHRGCPARGAAVGSRARVRAGARG